MQKNYLKIETSEVLSFYADKDIYFENFRHILLDVYNDYPNKNKLIILFKYWLYIISSIRTCYGEDALKKFCESNDTVFGFAYKYELNFNRENKTIKENRKSYKFYILYPFFSIYVYFIKTFFLPGANLSTFKKKIINMISSLSFINLKLENDHDLLRKMNIFLKNYFSDISPDEILLIINKLPKIFSSKKINFKNINRCIKIQGAAAAFLNFDGYENILLIDKEIFIDGFQHGGGYDVFKDDYYYNFEKKLCNKFSGWGFSDVNIKQYKFKKIISNKDNRDKKIFWIEDILLPQLYHFTSPLHFNHVNNSSIKEYIYNELNDNKLPYSSLKHPVYESPYYLNYRQNYFNINYRVNSEKIISNNDICIFDNISSTLIYFCITNKIIFMIIISHNDFDNLTIKCQEWFLSLHKNNLAFFNNESNKLYNSIKNCLTKEYKLPQEIIDIHETF